MNLLKWLIGDTGNVSSEELAHINQEMYKKSVELSEKNKALSLLRKIDEIVLSSVTDTQLVAQQVADASAIDAGFSVVAIYLVDKFGILRRVALSKTDLMVLLQQRFDKNIFQEEVPISHEENVLAKVYNEQNMEMLQGVRCLLISDISDEVLGRIKVLDEIKTTFIYPLRIRDKSLGVFAVGLRENGDDISPFHIDLVERLADVIGIAIDNALLYQEIRDANEHLKELDRLKDEFVSLASHELRTPMTSIKSYLWMALTGQGGELNDKQKYYLQRSYNSVDRLIKLVNDMLNVSRIESGRLTVMMKSLDIKELIKDIIEDIHPRAAELGLTIELTEQDGIPEVLADPDKIKEVIYNLVGNSLKFTPREGKITVSCVQKDGVVEISVKDTGSGIEPEDLPKLFQKFGMLPGSYVTNQPAMGTGLGLYICRSLIELHGGKISAASEGKGKGATFTFSLKVFSQDELDKFNEKHKQQSQGSVGLIHKDLS